MVLLQNKSLLERLKVAREKYAAHMNSKAIDMLRIDPELSAEFLMAPETIEEVLKTLSSPIDAFRPIGKDKIENNKK